MTANPEHSTAQRIVTICDEDPVMRLTAIALRGANPEDRLWIEKYFSPEHCTPEQVEAVGGDRRSSRLEVRVLAAEQESDLARISAGSQVLICRRARIGRGELAASPNLRRINRLGADPAGIDLEAVREAGVELRCIPRPTLALTAEHAVLLMLAASKNLLEADRRTRVADWDRQLVHPVKGVAYNWPAMNNLGGLYGRTVGLIGLGQVGLLVAERLQGFGARLLYHKPTRLHPDRETSLGLEGVSLAELLARSDIVSLHARWTPQTEGMMDASTFARMKPGAIFVSTSRGALVDEDALADALETGKLGFAALDTHAAEPRPASTRLGKAPNTIFTPHIAGGSRLRLLEEVAALLDGI